ncbi:TauD/TfdA family dioxygenase [Brevibacillus parabrevis]|uniref:TauD/TfdA family dioxygenase n=1 Tax=Brevibacillus parabrevis TaxID=54914 RepID=UPI002E24C11C|nr:TauD/TfdA family dioxygenase [Brevibacillus parabrevis]MED1724563.1 TauD/TfdA family dioxygenase [Brevibacillus parabrevis]
MQKGVLGIHETMFGGQVIVSLLPDKDRTLPLVVRPAVDNLDLHGWVKENSTLLEDALLKCGGILFRDFQVPTIASFENLAKCFGSELVEYGERSTPRTEVQGRVYTSTEYPADQSIPQHNENSYAHQWAMKIWFYCDQPAIQGGETPIADSREVLSRIDPAIVKRFMEKKVMYVRNYGGGLDLPWEDVFGTNEKAAVEQYCKNMGMEYTWLDGDRLRTRSLRPAVAKHPKTGEYVWFNQAHLFHVTNLPEEIRDYIMMTVPEESYPRNTYFGDGQPIDAAILEEIRNVLESASIYFPWQKTDVMMLDNMLVSHGRAPFAGPRKVVVAMADPSTNYSFDFEWALR